MTTKHKEGILLALTVVFAVCVVVVGAYFGSKKLEDYQKSKDQFFPLGKLLSVELVSGGILGRETSKIITDQGTYFVYGAVNTKFHTPVVLHKKYGWDRDDCISIAKTCYTINGETPETE